jgi:hypothetical protein
MFTEQVWTIIKITVITAARRRAALLPRTSVALEYDRPARTLPMYNADVLRLWVTVLMWK